MAVEREYDNWANKGPESGDRVSVKINASAYRLLRTVAAWRDLSISDYLSEIVAREVGKELDFVVNELGKLQEQNTRVADGGETPAVPRAASA